MAVTDYGLKRPCRDTPSTKRDASSGSLFCIGESRGFGTSGWSANLFTTTLDMFPRKLVGSVVGIGGFAGAVGGMLFQTSTGYLLEWTGNNYTPMFIVCGLAYLGALGVIQLLAPNDPWGHEYGNNGRDATCHEGRQCEESNVDILFET